MKKVIVILILLLSGAFLLYGQESKFSLGINSGIGTEPDNSYVWGVVAGYNITNTLRIVPEFNLSFRENDFVNDRKKWTNYTGSIYLHYLFRYKRISFYPLAGVSFTNGKDRVTSLGYFNTMKVFRIGGSFGGGIEYNFLRKFYVNGEARYSILHRIWKAEGPIAPVGSEKNLNNFGILLGIGYKF
jgi:opacity protein-like surface antigen